jgi:hypothetical protein
MKRLQEKLQKERLLKEAPNLLPFEYLAKTRYCFLVFALRAIGLPGELATAIAAVTRAATLAYFEAQTPSPLTESEESTKARSMFIRAAMLQCLIPSHVLHQRATGQFVAGVE